jgi:hypothetical protein
VVGYQHLKPGKLLRDWSGYAATNNAWNFGGDAIDESFATGGNVTFRSLWAAGASVLLEQARMSDRLTRGGPLARVPGGWFVSLFGNSDPRKPISGTFSTSLQANSNGGWERGANASLVLRPSTTVRLSVGPSLDVLRSTNQFVTARPDSLASATFGRRYVFADLHQTTVGMETRVDWTFTPTLSLQLYAQPFVSAGSYTGYKEFLQPRTERYGVYGRDLGTIAHDPAQHLYAADPDGAGPAQPIVFFDPDFNFRSLRGNAVLRWEYRPGSALYLVWQQERAGVDPTGTFSFGHDAGEIFREPATNVFLVKVTYWLGR